MRKVFIIFITFILVFLLSSCKKCNKEEYKYYIIEQYNKNIDYTNSAIDNFNQNIDYINNLMHNYGLNLSYSKLEKPVINKADNGTVMINFPLGIGVIMENPQYNNHIIYDMAKDGAEKFDDYIWNMYLGDNYLFQKQVVSYAIIFGKPQSNDDIEYYDHRDMDGCIYLSGLKNSLNENEKVLYIPENITNILGYSFHMNPYITEVVCNSNLDTIHHSAFKTCFFLKHIKLNTGLKRIGAKAFYNCSDLEYIVIPESVKEMGCEVFISGNIFCEAEYKPFDWRDNWATKNAKVYWKGEWEYNSEGIPVPISE